MCTKGLLIILLQKLNINYLGILKLHIVIVEHKPKGKIGVGMLFILRKNLSNVKSTLQNLNCQFHVISG